MQFCSKKLFPGSKNRKMFPNFYGLRKIYGFSKEFMAKYSFFVPQRAEKSYCFLKVF